MRLPILLLQPRQQAPVERLWAGHGEEYFLLDADEILAFQADGELVWIVTAKQRLLATQTLRVIEERLKEPQFQRVIAMRS